MKESREEEDEGEIGRRMKESTEEEEEDKGVQGGG